MKNNKTVCQENCVFSKYNYEIQKAYCSCEVKQSSKSFDDMYAIKHEPKSNSKFLRRG